jgi:hypothetical protein
LDVHGRQLMNTWFFENCLAFALVIFIHEGQPTCVYGQGALCSTAFASSPLRCCTSALPLLSSGFSSTAPTCAPNSALDCFFLLEFWILEQERQQSVHNLVRSLISVCLSVSLFLLCSPCFFLQVLCLVVSTLQLNFLV